MPRNRSEKELVLSGDAILALKTIRASSPPEQAATTNYFRERLSGVHRDELAWRKHWEAMADEVRWIIMELSITERKQLYGVLSA